MSNNRLIRLCLLACLWLPARLAHAWIYENAYEFQTEGDFDGDGRMDLVIVDKVSGACRLGYQLTAGHYTWVGPRASGVPNMTGFTLGRLFSTNRDSFAFTAFDANRVNLLDASNAVAPSQPQSVFITNVGLNMVGAIDIGGPGNTAYDDLYIGTLNDTTFGSRWTTLRHTGTALDFLAENALSGWYSYPAFQDTVNKVVLKTTAAPYLACMGRLYPAYAPSRDTLFLHCLTNGTPTPAMPTEPWFDRRSATPPGGTPQNLPYQYLIAPFSATNPLSQLLVYMSYPAGFSGSNSWFWWWQFKETSSGTYSYGSVKGSLYLTNCLNLIYMLPGATAIQLLLLLDDGAVAEVYSFNGVTTPTLVRRFAPEPGEHFTGAGALGGNGFMAYSAPVGQHTSSRFKQWN